TDLARGIRGQFDRLYWPGATPNSNGALLTDTDTDLDPTKVPPLHLDVADLRFGDAKLGQLMLQTHPIAQGLRIEQLDTSAKSQTVNATGDWTRQGPTATRTHLAIEFHADSLGKMLDAFGFEGVVAAGKTEAKLQGGWPGSPAAFRMAVLDGTLDLDVGEGRLLEVKPGAGRVLGLVSLAELPRRLTLDFRDFFDKGFSFKTLRGRFVFANGQAHTDDLAIKGPAADIHVSGSADLVAQRYDQTIEVLPRAGGIVTAVGALAGGPIGAAVGAVAGEVLKHPLQQMGRKRYHVTGPWNNPDVKLLPGGTSNGAAPSDPVSG
ncbi:MAG TPA: AsmA-like C-terminal region-containing protein, partial [Xanthomonadaceae bacterium]|nr:AsmA-like C-terminal region-containing protein [Xanthomonadaceae bacterium]